MNFRYENQIKKKIYLTTEYFDFNSILKRQIDSEIDFIHKIEQIIDNTKNPLYRNLMIGLYYNTLKHQYFCQALEDIISGESLLVRERVEIANLMETHSKTIIKNLRILIQQNNNPAIRCLLNEYKNDEAHHKNLVTKLNCKKFTNMPYSYIMRHYNSTETNFQLK